MHDVGICIPFFAAADAPRRDRNLRRTIKKTLTTCDEKQIVVVECDMGHVCTANIGVSHIVEGDALWQKERLMQIGCEILIKRGYKKLVCMDGDCIIKRKDWLSEVSEKLNRYKAVQCFGQLRSVGDERTLTGTGAAVHYEKTGKIKRVTSGGIWAYHASVIKAAGFYQHCIVGSGDAAHFVSSVSPTEAVTCYRLWGYSENMLAELSRWANRWHKAVNKRISHVECLAAFQPHGRRDARGCGDRHGLLRTFEPTRDVSAKPGQGLKWSSRKPLLHKRVGDYVRMRSA